MIKKHTLLFTTIIVLGLLVFSIAQNNSTAIVTNSSPLRDQATSGKLNAVYTVGNLFANVEVQDNGTALHIIYGFDLNTTDYWSGQIYAYISFYSDANLTTYVGMLWYWDNLNSSISQPLSADKYIPSPLAGDISIQIYLEVYTYDSSGNSIFETSQNFSFTNLYVSINDYFNNLSLNVDINSADVNGDSLDDIVNVNVSLTGPAYPYANSNTNYDTYILVWIDIYDSSGNLQYSYSYYFNVFYDVNNSMYNTPFIPIKNDTYTLTAQANFLDSYTFLNQTYVFNATKTRYFDSLPRNLSIEPLDLDSNGSNDTLRFAFDYYSDSSFLQFSYDMNIDIYVYDYNTSQYVYYSNLYFWFYPNAFDSWNHASRYFFPGMTGDYMFNVTLYVTSYNLIPIDTYIFYASLDASPSSIFGGNPIYDMNWDMYYYSYFDNQSSSDPTTIDLISYFYYQQYNNTETSSQEISMYYFIDIYDPVSGTYAYYDSFSHNFTLYGNYGSYSGADDLYFTAHDNGLFRFTVILEIGGVYFGQATFELSMAKAPIYVTYSLYTTNYSVFDSNNDNIDDTLEISFHIDLQGNNLLYPVNVTITAIFYQYVNDSYGGQYTYYTTQRVNVTIWQSSSDFTLNFYLNTTGAFSIDISADIPDYGLYNQYITSLYVTFMDHSMTSTTSSSSSTTTSTSSTTSTSTSTTSETSSETTNTETTTTTSNDTISDTNSTSPPPLPLPLNPVTAIILPFTFFGVLSILRKRSA